MRRVITVSVLEHKTGLWGFHGRYEWLLNSRKGQKSPDARFRDNKPGGHILNKVTHC